VSAHVYDPASVRLSIAGPPVIVEGVDGFSPGTFIRAVPAIARFKSIPGVRGQMTRVRNRLRMGRIEFTLEQAAKANLALTALAFADETSGSAITAIMIKDGSSLLDLVVAPQAWIEQIPASAKGVSSGTITWVFECASLWIIHGGLRQAEGGDNPNAFAFEGKDFG